jgi:hypothetical protein
MILWVAATLVRLQRLDIACRLLKNAALHCANASGKSTGKG